MSEAVFTESRSGAIVRAVDRALPFLDESGFRLGAAWGRHQCRDAAAADVLDALSGYQQADGGFAGLEVDIRAQVSTAFDGRLAMHVLLGLPNGGQTEIAQRLGEWYVQNQHEDGDWHFPPEVYEHELAPWFAAWEFPNLNPSCCIAGLTHALGIATPAMLERVEGIWRAQSSIDQARSGDFYTMLPYIEYVAHIDVDERDAWFDAIADGIDRGIAANSFGDAEHALEHLVGAGPNVIAKLDRDSLVKVVDAVLADQQDDGGWPTPYDANWRPWFTANTIVLLAQLQATIV